MLQMTSQKMHVGVDIGVKEDGYIPTAPVMGWVYEKGLVLPVIMWKGYIRVLQIHECGLYALSEPGTGVNDTSDSWEDEFVEQTESQDEADMPVAGP